LFDVIQRMDLKTYFFALPPDEREPFAIRSGTSKGHMQNVAYGYAKPSTALCVAVEKESGGIVTRAEMRPEDYWLHWPDLAAPTKEAA
jgi:DNA-binding transcriptional regulator YdaS (Cro superfamily)